MSRLAIQIVFVALGLLWLGLVMIDLLGSIMGDCADSQWCEGRKSVAAQLVFWRGICVALLIVFAYRFFRKDPDV